MKTRFLLAVGLALMALAAYATTFYPIPMEQRVDDASFIVRGITGKSYAGWLELANKKKRIFTFIPLDVKEVIKGEIQAESILVRELGGEVDGIGMKVPSSAQFQVNEDVVLMLGSPERDGSFPLRALIMGKFNISTGPKGEEVLTGAALDTDPAQKNQDHDHGHNDSHPSKFWSFSEFKKLVSTRQALMNLKNTNHSGEAKQNAAKPQTSASPLQSLRGDKGEGTAEVTSSFAPVKKDQQGLGWTWLLLAGIILVGVLGLLLVSWLRR